MATKTDKSDEALPSHAWFQDIVSIIQHSVFFWTIYLQGLFISSKIYIEFLVNGIYLTLHICVLLL